MKFADNWRIVSKSAESRLMMNFSNVIVGISAVKKPYSNQIHATHRRQAVCYIFTCCAAVKDVLRQFAFGSGRFHP